MPRDGVPDRQHDDGADHRHQGGDDKAVMFVTDSAVQTLGGYGFIREYPVERLLRNARGFTTFDGLAII